MGYYPALTGGASGPAGGELAGTYPNPTLSGVHTGTFRTTDSVIANAADGANQIVGRAASDGTDRWFVRSTAADRNTLELAANGQINVRPGTTLRFFDALGGAGRAGAIAAPTAPSAVYVQAEVASMKTAVDAIRTALLNLGLTA